MGEDSSSLLITFGVSMMLGAVMLSHSLTVYKIGFIHESGLFIMLGLFGGSLFNPKTAESNRKFFEFKEKYGIDLGEKTPGNDKKHDKNDKLASSAMDNDSSPLTGK